MVDYGTAVIGPGLVDVHVHMNDPGRVEWEGAVSKHECFTWLQLQQRQYRRRDWTFSAPCQCAPLLRALCDRWRASVALHATDGGRVPHCMQHGSVSKFPCLVQPLYI